MMVIVLRLRVVRSALNQQKKTKNRFFALCARWKREGPLLCARSQNDCDSRDDGPKYSLN